MHKVVIDLSDKRAIEGFVLGGLESLKDDLDGGFVCVVSSNPEMKGKTFVVNADLIDFITVEDEAEND